MQPRGLFWCLIPAVLLGVVAIHASNMGFKVAISLRAGSDPGTDGDNYIGLPYKIDPSLATASDLMSDINQQAGSDIVVSVARYDPATGWVEAYTGESGPDFPLAKGEGYIVTVDADLDYEVVGAHDSSHVIELLGPEDANSIAGEQLLAVPYNTKAADAFALAGEMGGFQAVAGGPVASISRYVASTDALDAYSGTGAGFPIVQGESYLVKVTRTTRFLPSAK